MTGNIDTNRPFDNGAGVGGGVGPSHAGEVELVKHSVADYFAIDTYKMQKDGIAVVQLKGEGCEGITARVKLPPEALSGDNAAQRDALIKILEQNYAQVPRIVENFLKDESTTRVVVHNGHVVGATMSSALRQKQDEVDRQLEEQAGVKGVSSGVTNHLAYAKLSHDLSNQIFSGTGKIDLDQVNKTIDDMEKVLKKTEWPTTFLGLKEKSDSEVSDAKHDFYKLFYDYDKPENYIFKFVRNEYRRDDIIISSKDDLTLAKEHRKKELEALRGLAREIANLQAAGGTGSAVLETGAKKTPPKGEAPTPAKQTNPAPAPAPLVPPPLAGLQATESAARAHRQAEVSAAPVRVDPDDVDGLPPAKAKEAPSTSAEGVSPSKVEGEVKSSQSEVTQKKGGVASKFKTFRSNRDKP